MNGSGRENGAGVIVGTCFQSQKNVLNLAQVVLGAESDLSHGVHFPRKRWSS